MTINRSGFCRNAIVAILMFLGCAQHACAQGGIDTGLANALQNALDATRVLYNVKGISAAAYIPGKGMWKGVTGVSYDPVPIDTTMLLGIGSVTKTFVAAETFRLIEAGMLSLSDTVGALLPPMTNVNPGITVGQLLSHTSGMGDFVNTAWQSAMFSDPTSIWYFPDVLSAFCSPAAGSPGSPWHYCNANYSILGMIIEAKKGDSLHHVLRHDFIEPYSLGDINMEVFEPYANPIPHNWATPTLNPALATDASGTPHQALWSSVEAAGGYFADAASIARWGHDLYSGNVISSSSLAQMLNFTSVSGGYFNGYGMGSMRFTANGRTYYGHAGNYYGYAASMLYYPADSICVAVLINQDCIATYEARTLMNVLINTLAAGVKEEISAEQVTISPNPANNQLTILVPGNKRRTAIAITDATGRTIYQTTTNNNSCIVNTDTFGNGDCFVKISAGSLSETRQVSIRH